MLSDLTQGPCGCALKWSSDSFFRESFRGGTTLDTLDQLRDFHQTHLSSQESDTRMYLLTLTNHYLISALPLQFVSMKKFSGNISLLLEYLQGVRVLGC